MEERLRTGKGHWIRMGKSTKNRSGYMEMFSNCDFSYSSETANFRNTIAFKRLAHTDYFRTANQHAVRERHKRNGYENTQKKLIGKTTGETYMENYKRNALGPTVRQTTWKTSIEEHHKRNGYANPPKKLIGKTTGETYMENYKRNALGTTVRRTTWKTSIEDITRETGMQTYKGNG